MRNIDHFGQPLRLRLGMKFDGDLAEVNPVTILELVASDAEAVDEGTVGAAQILVEIVVADLADHGVALRDHRIVHADRTLRMAPDGRFIFDRIGVGTIGGINGYLRHVAHLSRRFCQNTNEIIAPHDT